MTKAEEWNALADWYDVLWPRVDDLTFYLDLAKHHGNPVLELGCGGGRVTCELAKAGHRVVGIDVSPGQLARAEKRKEGLDAEHANLVEFRLQSMTSFDFPERFGLIVAPFSAMLELGGPPDRLATYECCARHLAAGGVLAFDNWFRGTGENADWGKPRPPKCALSGRGHTSPKA